MVSKEGQIYFSYFFYNKILTQKINESIALHDSQGSYSNFFIESHLTWQLDANKEHIWREYSQFTDFSVARTIP